MHFLRVAAAPNRASCRKLSMQNCDPRPKPKSLPSVNLWSVNVGVDESARARASGRAARASSMARAGQPLWHSQLRNQLLLRRRNQSLRLPWASTEHLLRAIGAAQLCAAPVVSQAWQPQKPTRRRDPTCDAHVPALVNSLPQECSGVKPSSYEKARRDYAKVAGRRRQSK